MKLLRHLEYFRRLRQIIGFKASLIFVFMHLFNKLNPPSNGRLARILVGPYVFYFPSIDYFVVLFTEIFFKETYYLTIIDDEINIIDCGANIGMSLLYIKIRAPRSKVLCFEPNPDARVVLEKNIIANNWTREVKVLPYALGLKKGVVDFFIDKKESTGSGGSLMNKAKNTSSVLKSYKVEINTLSQYIDGQIALLKIDIEGAEFDVLEELITTKKIDSVNEIQLEYHYIPEAQQRPVSEILKLLESNGFKTYIKSNSAPHTIVGKDIWHTYMVFAWRNSSTINGMHASTRK